MDTISNGAWAHQLVERSLDRLEALQAPVLADDGDPEPLHRLRVAMRRLRTVLSQFAPALVLPERVGDARIARIARRLGRARDLDVLRGRLERELLPALPEPERRRLAPVLQQLRRERRQAGRQLSRTLAGGGYRGLRQRLGAWVHQPAFTPLGQEPLTDWLVEWQIPLLATLALHPGWRVAEGDADPRAVHDLRKRCKGARYALENLQPLGGEAMAAWVARFRDLQDLLGELNDLEVLAAVIRRQLPGRLEDSLPALQAEVARRHALGWARWRREAVLLHAAPGRRGLLADLLAVTPTTAPGS